MKYTDIEVRGRDKIKSFKKVVLFGAGSYLSEVLDTFSDYNVLADEESKQFLDNVIKFKLTHNPLWLVPNPHIVGKYMYQGKAIEDMIMVKKGDHIIDGGAFTGDSTEFFLRVTDGACNVYCFEPFEGNFKILDKMVQDKKLQNQVKVFNMALGNKNDIVRISAETDISARSNINASEKKGNQIVQKS